MHPPRAIATMTLLVALAGCGGTTRSPSAEPARTGTERITAQGVAALVDEHLGAENVKWYGTYDDDQDEVDVVVRLEGASGPHMFVVGAASPDSEEYGFPGDEVTCDQMEAGEGRRGQEVWCQDLEGGGVATVQLLPTGFSDGNHHGRSVIAFANQPDGRTATAMYETFTPTVDVDPETLLALMADERLAWTTDPAVNQAGSHIEVRRLEG